MNTHTSLQPLSSEVISPTRRYLPVGSLPAVVVATGTIAALAGTAVLGHHLLGQRQAQPAVQVVVLNKPPPVVMRAPRPAPMVVQPAQLPSAPIAEPVAEPVPTLEPAAVLPRNGEHALAFELDGRTYIAIHDLEQPDPWAGPDEARPAAEPYPAHGPLRVVGDREYPDGVIASVRAADLAPDIAAWRGHEVVLTGAGQPGAEGCRGRVDEFALIGLISGSPLEYLGPYDGPDDARIAGDLLRFGNAIIAGRVSACDVRQGIARSATLAPAVRADKHIDSTLARAARELFLAGDDIEVAQQAYEDAGFSGSWWQSQETTFTVRIYRHPGNGRRTVSVHAVADDGCGGADINLWAVYDVTAAGDLERRAMDSTMHLVGVLDAIDIDGDGVLEFLATTGFGDAALLSSTGRLLLHLEVPFHGCPC